MNAAAILNSRYGDNWPEWADDFMLDWQRKIVPSSGPGFGDVMRGVPGTPHGGGPVVYPRR
jgi:hypothetical protein